MIIIIAVIILMFILSLLGIKSSFDKSGYSKESNKRFMEVKLDKGLNGEYLSFRELERIQGYKKILVNAYIPKGNGEYSEIDLILIHETGIYVIESKNYGGWIWGNEKYKSWIQTFPNGHKEKFYSPIFQNNHHINSLKRFLSFNDINVYKSLIVFSERCTLKNIEIYSENIHVLKRDDLYKTLKNIANQSGHVLNCNQIDGIYNKIKPYTKVSKEISAKHISNINNRYK